MKITFQHAPSGKKFEDTRVEWVRKRGDRIHILSRSSSQSALHIRYATCLECSACVEWCNKSIFYENKAGKLLCNLATKELLVSRVWGGIVPLDEWNAEQYVRFIYILRSACKDSFRNVVRLWISLTREQEASIADSSNLSIFFIRTAASALNLVAAHYNSSARYRKIKPLRLLYAQPLYHADGVPLVLSYSNICTRCRKWHMSSQSYEAPQNCQHCHWLKPWCAVRSDSFNVDLRSGGKDAFCGVGSIKKAGCWRKILGTDMWVATLDGARAGAEEKKSLEGLVRVETMVDVGEEFLIAILLILHSLKLRIYFYEERHACLELCWCLKQHSGTYTASY